MDFDEWWLRSDQRLLDVFKRAFLTGNLGKQVAEEAWQAAQREAARRCAEIWHENQTPDFLSALSREFGLDRHE